MYRREFLIYTDVSSSDVQLAVAIEDKSKRSSDMQCGGLTSVKECGGLTSAKECGGSTRVLFKCSIRENLLKALLFGGQMRDVFPHYLQHEHVTLARYLRDYVHGGCAFFNLLLLPLGFPFTFVPHMVSTWGVTAFLMAFNTWFCSHLEGPLHFENAAFLHKVLPPAACACLHGNAAI